jgi:O-antigen ligase
VAGATLYCAIVITRIHPGADGRLPSAIYYDANDLAMVLVCTLPFVVYLLRPGTARLLQLLALPAFALIALTIVRTGSRGGFIALVVVLGYLLIAFGAIPKTRRAGALVAMVVLLASFGGSQYWDRMATLLKPSEDYNWSGNGGTGRVEIWKRGIGYMMDRPVLGVGASAFYVAEGTISDLAKLQARGHGLKWSAPHNSFVQIGAELGVFGLVAFVGLLWSAHAEARRRAPGADARSRAVGQVLSASVLGFTVAGFFLSQAYSAYLYSLLALVIASARLSPAAAIASATSAPRRLPAGARPAGARAAAAPTPGTPLPRHTPSRPVGSRRTSWHPAVRR